MKGRVASDPAQAPLAAHGDAAAPSTIDRLFRAVDRLPGPPELFYAAVGLGLAAAAQAVLWASGAYPLGAIESEVIQPPLVCVILLALTHLLIRVAAQAFEEFRPALGEEPDIERFRRQLISIPDRLAVVAMAAGAVIVFLADYLFVVPFAPTRPAIVDLLSAPVWFLAAAFAGLFVAHDIRQLRAVSRLSRTAPNVDIFKPASVNAFSRLTSVSAVAILLLVTGFVVIENDIPTAYLVQLAAVALLAVATFVLPLRAMHTRLEAEKARLQSAAQDRLKIVLARIHDAIERDDMSRADELQKTLEAVLAERELLERLHTWPWSTTTFRGVASALLLPVLIFVITRLIERLL